LRTLFLISIGLLFLPSFSDATDNISLRDYILTGLEYSYHENYDSAKAYFKRAIEEDPEDPSGYFFLCGLYGLYMSDFSTDEVEGLFLINLFDAAEAARKRIQVDSNDGWAHFYLGGAYGYRALREQRKGGLWGALGHALTAVAELKKAVSCDSTIYDAYMGIGSYHYFVNRLWAYIPFLGRDPDKGIREMKLAIERGIFVRVPAQDGLTYILLREKRYERALRLARDLVSRYPNSRTFRWTLGKVHLDMEDWGNASGTYRTLLSMIETGQPGNYHNLAYCGEKLSYCLYRLHRYEDALDICLEMLDVLDNPADNEATEQLRKDLERLREKILKAKAGQ